MMLLTYELRTTSAAMPTSRREHVHALPFWPVDEEAGVAEFLRLATELDGFIPDDGNAVLRCLILQQCL